MHVDIGWHEQNKNCLFEHWKKYQNYIGLLAEIEGVCVACSVNIIHNIRSVDTVLNTTKD